MRFLSVLHTAVVTLFIPIVVGFYTGLKGEQMYDSNLQIQVVLERMVRSLIAHLALKIYEIKSDLAVGALNIELANGVRQQGKLRWATLCLCLAAITLVINAGFRYSRRLQAELAEQMRLRTEVTQANEALETKVRQRTAELEAANPQLETLSATDGLTGLANRRSFDSYWAQEWQRALRQGTPLAVTKLDVDHFKAYSDHYRHQQGDACLRTNGDVLRVTIRRVGGPLWGRGVCRGYAGSN